jgi:DNA-binding XRE family transcriptional regulator
MPLWPQRDSPTKNRSRFTASSRRQAALRFLFRMPCSPEAKADFAMHFKAIRRRAGLTQTELGHMIGLCRQSVSEIENCHVWPHYTTLECFCELEARYLDS